MTSRKAAQRFRRALQTVCWLLPLAHAQAGPVEDGRSIYEDGRLPDGTALVATRPEGLLLEGQAAACATCHRDSGMGSIEGLGDKAILVPPVAGKVLFAPARFARSFLDTAHHYVPNDTWRRAMKRPAYDLAALGVALREGPNTDGELLEAPMPRYNLDDAALASLYAYLEHLSKGPDPGAADEHIHVATVVTPDVDPAVADAVLAVVGEWARSGRGSGKPLAAHAWRLEGTPDSWPAQLDAAYEKQPVFALLSGLGAAEWRPVAEFCETQDLACILPSVDFVPQPLAGLRSVYYSPGVGLEADVLAAYLAGGKGRAENRVVQLYADEAGAQAATALRGRLEAQDIGVVERRVRPTAPGLALAGLTASDTLILWLRPAELEQLAALNSDGLAVANVYASSLLATPDHVSLPDPWHEQIQFVTLFDDLDTQGEIARLRLERWLDNNGIDTDADRRILADAYAASYLFNRALAEIKRQEVRRPPVPLTRDHVLETLEDLLQKYSDGTALVDQDSHVAYYGRMSLGPDQRIAVRGGAIVRYRDARSNKLVTVSERIVP